MLTIETAASETDLVELATVKSKLGIADSSADDELGRLIDAASETIAGYLGYFPWRQTYTEKVAGERTHELLLSQMPIQSVTSVTVNGLLVTDYTILADAGILERNALWPWHPLRGLPVDYHPVAGSPKKNVSVEYVAGWLVPGEVGRDLPASIEQAAFETVIAWYGGKSGTGALSAATGNLKSVRIGDTAFSYGDGGGTSTVTAAALEYALPVRALARLRKYRRQS